MGTIDKVVNQLDNASNTMITVSKKVRRISLVILGADILFILFNTYIFITNPKITATIGDKIQFVLITFVFGILVGLLITDIRRHTKNIKDLIHHTKHMRKTLEGVKQQL